MSSNVGFETVCWVGKLLGDIRPCLRNKFYFWQRHRIFFYPSVANMVKMSVSSRQGYTAIHPQQDRGSVEAGIFTMSRKDKNSGYSIFISGFLLGGSAPEDMQRWDLIYQTGEHLPCRKKPLR